MTVLPRSGLSAYSFRSTEMLGSKKCSGSHRPLHTPSDIYAQPVETTAVWHARKRWSRSMRHGAASLERAHAHVRGSITVYMSEGAGELDHM
jgi:hypothetical protein